MMSMKALEVSENFLTSTGLGTLQGERKSIQRGQRKVTETGPGVKGRAPLARLFSESPSAQGLTFLPLRLGCFPCRALGLSPFSKKGFHSHITHTSPPLSLGSLVAMTQHHCPSQGPIFIPGCDAQVTARPDAEGLWTVKYLLLNFFPGNFICLVSWFSFILLLTVCVYVSMCGDVHRSANAWGGRRGH